MKSFVNSRGILAALAGFALVIGPAACGSDDPGSGSHSEGSTAGNVSEVGNGTDLAFIEAMVPHHRSAIEMATVARQRGQSTFVKSLAADIIGAQESEIKVMNEARAQLVAKQVKPSDLGISEHEMGMDMNGASLRTANPFDRAFIDMMVPHHQGAIRMARVELVTGTARALRSLAKDIIAAQSREIRAMNAHRRQAFGAASPAGGVPPSAAPSESGGHESGMSMDNGA